MTNDLGSGTNECLCGYLLDLNCVVGDKSMTSLYKLDSGFTLTYAAVTDEEKTFTVNLDENAVTGDSGGELGVKSAYERRHKGRGFFLCCEHRNVLFLAVFDEFLEHLKTRCEDHRIGMSVDKRLDLCTSFLLGKLGKIEVLCVTDKVKTFGIENFIKSRKTETGAHNLGALNENAFIVFGDINELEVEFLRKLR